MSEKNSVAGAHDSRSCSRKRKCKSCGKSEYDTELLKYYSKGEKLYICTRCLPVLIHGDKSCKH